ncbi:scarecrow-like protein 6 isoform X1 [Vigna radiata var. radiata]|uniref:Scarecrow-like protein 6 isoform X1 n=1 Tax=Vigna radiata var. radiata TaxID=3916 RepID=A0A1S3T932_VIGRR|nr:scarecrow-like protein 6 isoform X1 [Vigna radiata var. radiata]
MKAMPFPFEEFQGKGVLDFSSGSDSFSLLLHHPQAKWTIDKEDYCYVGSTEPTSVLDSRRSPNSSTMSSSLGSSNTISKGGSGGSTNNTTCYTPTLSQNPPQTALETSTEKCGVRMEDWESQDQSILRLIMADAEDPSVGLSKLFQGSGCGSQQTVDFNAGFGVVDQGLNMVSIVDPSGNYPGFPFIAENIDGHNGNKTGSLSVGESMFSVSGNNSLLFSTSPGGFNSQQQVIGEVDEKPQVINPQFELNQTQVQFSENPSLFVPMMYPQLQEQQVFSQHPAKRHVFEPAGYSYQAPRMPLLDSGQEMFGRRQQTQLPLFPHHMPPQIVPSAKPQKASSTGEDASHQLQQAIFDQLYKTAELIEAGNPVHAQGILARLNHQLSPIGTPFQRAAFYMKEALLSLLYSNPHNVLAFSPITSIFKIGAYKSFSEISPIIQFANFTSNQAIIEALERFDRIHIIDFDIGFGVQWSSFMQALAMRSNGVPSLKITAIVSPLSYDEFELNVTQEKLNQYAKDINMSFELNVLSIESLSSPSCPLSVQYYDNEATAVNMPLSCFTNYPTLFPLVLRFVKQLRPKVVVTLDRNCDQLDAPFSTNIVHALHCYSALLESLDAVNVNLDVLQKIEKHFILPSLKKTITCPLRSQEKLPTWRNMFLQYGFSPFTFSNFTEAQAECLVQKAPVRGFQLERKHSSLVLCWQRKELITVSTWRC